MPLGEVCQVKTLRSHDQNIELASAGSLLSCHSSFCHLTSSLLTSVQLRCLLLSAHDLLFLGMNVELGIVGVEFSSVMTGSILCDPMVPMPMVTRFRTQLLTFGTTYTVPSDSTPLIRATRTAPSPPPPRQPSYPSLPQHPGPGHPRQAHLSP